MNELEKRIVDKLGISPEIAHKVILVAMDYAKEKLAPPMFNDIRVALDMPEIKEEEAKELGLFRFP